MHFHLDIMCKTDFLQNKTVLDQAKRVLWITHVLVCQTNPVAVPPHFATVKPYKRKQLHMANEKTQNKKSQCVGVMLHYLLFSSNVY